MKVKKGKADSGARGKTDSAVAKKVGLLEDQWVKACDAAGIVIGPFE
jgi:hypothetical protein